MIADLWRQQGFFNPDWLGKNKVHVVGVGATGSHIVDTLACMGINQIVVYDFDVVENYNLPNQIYSLEDVGMKKVDALKRHVQRKMGYDIEAIDAKVEKIENMEGYLVLCTDSMEVQKSILMSSARMNPKVLAVVETRMGIDNGRVYFFDPNLKGHLQKYNSRWYSDEEAENAPCNLKSISMTAKLLAALAAGRIVLDQRRLHEGKTETPLYNETIIHACGNVINTLWN